MRKFKKVLSVLLAVTILLSTFGIGISVNAEKATRINTETENTSPLAIEVTTDKESYGKYKIANVTVTVTNTSEETIENISAEAVFNDISPVKKDSETFKEVEALKADESFSFSYKATISMNKLNFFEKIALWFVRIFNGGFTATENNFDDGRECATENYVINFGNKTSNNTVSVWYGDIDIDFDIENEQMTSVQDKIDSLCDSDTFKNLTTQEKASLLGELLETLEEQGEVKNVRQDGVNFFFEFKYGWGSGVIVEDSHNYDCFGNSGKDSTIEIERKLESNQFNTMQINTYSTNDEWTFSIGTADSSEFAQELANQYLQLGISVNTINEATVQTYSEFDNSKFIYIHSHGTVYENTPVILTSEVATEEKKEKYKSYENDIEPFRHVDGDGEWYFYIKPSFFENVYDNNELDNAIVYLGFCEAFGTDNIENYAFYNSFKNAGADTVIGFCNSVTQGYSVYFAEKLLYYMSQGDTVYDSYNKTVYTLGLDDNDFWENYDTVHNAYWDEKLNPAYPIFCGEKNLKLFEKQIEGLGNFTAKVLDKCTNEPIENVAVYISSYTYTDTDLPLAHCFKTNDNGYFTVNLPEGNYKCILSHKNYVSNNFEFTVDANNSIVMQDSIYLTPTTCLMGVVLDKTTSKPISGVTIELVETKNPNSENIPTVTTDENGEFALKIEDLSIQRTFKFTHKDYYELTSTIASYSYSFLEEVRLTRKEGIVSGNVVYDSVTKTPIPNVKVEIIDNSSDSFDPMTTVTTDENGRFSLYLPYGDYSLSYNHENYEYYGINLHVNSDYVVLLDPVYLTPKSTNAKGITVTGSVADETSREVIPNVTVKVYDNINCNNSPVQTVTTDENGEFTIKLLYNECAVVFTCDGYEEIKKTYTYTEDVNSSLIQLKFRLNPIYLTKSEEDYGTLTETGSCGENAYYDYYESTGTLVIRGSGDMEDYYKYYNVPWYNYRENINKVIIGNSVTSIGENTFYDCTSLTSVTIGDSVTSIGVEAFRGCTNLTSITIPDSVTSIGENTFDDCTSLTSVTIGNSVTSIGSYAFRGCTNLTSITIPDSVTSSIGYSVFEDCTSLTSVTIGNSVTSIGSYAFRGCTNLTSITIPDSVTSIGYSAFNDCTKLTSVTIGNGVTIIGEKAFEDCASLTSVTIGNGVTSIGVEAFCNCTDLTSITIPDSVTSIGRYAFLYCSKLTNVSIGNSVTSIGRYAFYGCTHLTSITIPDSVTSIGDHAFAGCTSLTSVTIGNGVTSIGDFAFADCTSLASVTIGNSVTSIGSYAFRGCTNLTSITIPDSVTSIGEHTFDDCTSLTSITVPDSVTSIGSYAFRGCTNLASITVENSNKAYSSDTFGVLFNKNKTELIYYPIGNSRTSYTIPDSVTYIGVYAFCGCENLTSIKIPNSVIKIDNGAFCNCTDLTSITIPDSVTSIGRDAFLSCSSLTSVTIGNSVTSINYDTFNNCTSLTSVTIGNSVTHIESSAFEDCTSLASVTIGDSVTRIDHDTFEDCEGLKNITFYNPNTSIYDWAGTIHSGASITGYAGSTAEAYAKKYNRTFIYL